MHHITPQAEQLLRAQGVTDAELDELRRTGRLERRSGDGSSSMSVDVSELSAIEMPPEVLDKLRRFHRFMPKQMRDNVELATGLDFDGDGLLAGGAPAPGGSTETPAVAPPAPVERGTGVPASAHDHVTRSPHGYSPSGAMPQDAGGPFVQSRRGGSLLVPLLALLAVGAVAYVVFVR